MPLELTVSDKPTFDEMAIQRGLDTYNGQFGYTPFIELTAFVHNTIGRVAGGIYGELSWNWLYIDLLWVDSALQERGYGRQLVSSIEQEARRRGVEWSFLATTSFQSLAFYYHIGYRLFGVLEDRPPGYNYYYMQRRIPALAEGASGRLPLLPVEEDPDPQMFEALKRGLADYNRAKGATPDGRRLAVFLRDDTHILGGLIGATYWGWLDIQAVWLHESLRRQGWGKQMLDAAEDEAYERGCNAAVTDVSDFQNIRFFQSQGYESFGTLADRPIGHTTHFLRKQL